MNANGLFRIRNDGSADFVLGDPDERTHLLVNTPLHDVGRKTTLRVECFAHGLNSTRSIRQT
jgi:hypothetical protein